MTDEEPIIEVIHSGEEIILEEPEPKLPRYKVIYGETKAKLEANMNFLADIGYKQSGNIVIMSSMNPQFWVSMNLDLGNYAGVTALQDVPSKQVTTYLTQGWEIASASISTKFVRMIWRGVQPEGE